MTAHRSLLGKTMLLLIFVIGMSAWVYGLATGDPRSGNLFWICLSVLQMILLMRDLRLPLLSTPVTPTTDDFVRKLQRPDTSMKLRMVGIFVFSLTLLFNIYLFVSE